MTTFVEGRPAARRMRPISERIAAMFALQRSRADLRSLDDHLLSDIGLSREEAFIESRRAPWDVQRGWRA